MRPDIEIKLLRGNVQTRLRKVAEGAFAGTLLALAGLRRLGLEHEATYVIPVEDFLPAAGQGAIGITARCDDARLDALLAPILCEATGIALAAERGFLTALDGSCRTPIGAHALVEGGRVTLRGSVLRPDGVAGVRRGGLRRQHRTRRWSGAPPAKPFAARLPPGFFEPH